jgi:hypothetical protein
MEDSPSVRRRLPDCTNRLFWRADPAVPLGSRHLLNTELPTPEKIFPPNLAKSHIDLKPCKAVPGAPFPLMEPAMQRSAARTKAVSNPSKLTRAEPQVRHEDASPVAPRPSGGGPGGRFVAGNRGGPGNPNARHCARMLDLFRACISDEDMVHLYRVLYNRAMKGDVSAAKLVLAYKIR